MYPQLQLKLDFPAHPKFEQLRIQGNGSYHPEVLQPDPTNNPELPKFQSDWLFLPLVCLVLSSACGAFWLSHLWLRKHKGIFWFKQSPQARCQNCRFFSDNNYLRCAVRPQTVMTQQALECSDHSPKEN